MGSCQERYHTQVLSLASQAAYAGGLLYTTMNVIRAMNNVLHKQVVGQRALYDQSIKLDSLSLLLGSDWSATSEYS